MADHPETGEFDDGVSFLSAQLENGRTGELTYAGAGLSK